MNMLKNCGITRWAMVPAMVLAAASAGAQVAHDPAMVVGSTECAECHKKENELWQGSRHFKTFREMPRQDEARKIARKMGIRRIKGDTLCLDCHFTTSFNDKGRRRAVAGVSCESCHGAGLDFIEVHSEFSGKEEADETPEEEAARWVAADEAGMIRPSGIHDLAANCYSCHVVSNEELVNKGGHPAASDFDLVAWSQGEVRHNVWYNNGETNAEAGLDTKRKMFVVGLAVEVEALLRAVGKATERADYAVEMAKRADRARKRLAEAAKVLGVPELTAAAEAAAEAQLKLDNEVQLAAIADRIRDATRALAEHHDGSGFGGIDRALPGSDRYVGTPGG